MNDIAKTAGYSKATLYVYFENKEEIIGFLVLDSMKKLYSYITSALEQQEATKRPINGSCKKDYLTIMQKGDNFLHIILLSTDLRAHAITTPYTE